MCDKNSHFPYHNPSGHLAGTYADTMLNAQNANSIGHIRKAMNPGLKMRDMFPSHWTEPRSLPLKCSRSLQIVTFLSNSG